MPFLVFLLATVLAGCGQKGPLYLPGSPVPGAPVTAPEEAGPPAEVLPSAPANPSPPAATRPSDLPE